MRKKLTILIAVLSVFIFILVAISFLWYTGNLGNEDRKYFLKIKKEDQSLVQIFNDTKNKEKELSLDPENQTFYLQIGLGWKSIAERSVNPDVKKYFFSKSLGVYRVGVDMFENKNILFYLNAGNVAKVLNTYPVAEDYYKQAVSNFPGEAEAYLKLADLYIYSMHMPTDKVLEVYDAGLKRVFNAQSILQARAEYYKKIGNLKAALKDYQNLAKAFPDNNNFKILANEVQSQLNNK